MCTRELINGPNTLQTAHHPSQYVRQAAALSTNLSSLPLWRGKLNLVGGIRSQPQKISRLPSRIKTE